MKNTNKEFFETLKGVIGGLILLALFVLFFTCCTSSKKIFGKKEDTNYLSAVDSGAVKKDEVKEDLEWWREIQNFLPDTVTNTTEKTYQPIIKPVQIIREYGKQSTQIINYDSIWNNKLDSLTVKLYQKEVEKETKVFSFWQIIGFGLLAYVVLRIFEKGILGRFTIVRK